MYMPLIYSSPNAIAIGDWPTNAIAIGDSPANTIFVGDSPANAIAIGDSQWIAGPLASSIGLRIGGKGARPTLKKEFNF